MSPIDTLLCIIAERRATVEKNVTPTPTHIFQQALQIKQQRQKENRLLDDALYDNTDVFWSEAPIDVICR